ncbi:hypothetical protein JMJ35_010293 [Cladonia borealis]|uniref:Cytochrome P450 n=1 Tax=Cladonia borealis TaxID=184061 RepID=A0AA39V611_9LECA|nr:hypothetical protein JMJ35_010293 [Cladonia borealis]
MSEFNGPAQDIFGRSLFFACSAVALYTGYQLVIAIYNVWFHPLASFPGPRIAAATQIPYVKAPTWSGYRLLSCHFIDASAWHDIHGHHADAQPFEKDPRLNVKCFNNVDNLFTAKHEDHERMRKVLGHAFSERAIKEQEPTVQLYIEKLIHRLHEQISSSSQAKVDMVKWYDWLSFDIIDLTFGSSFKCLETQANHWWVDMVFGSIEAIVFMGACHRFTISRTLLTYLIPKRYKKMFEDHWKATEETLACRIKLGTNRHDFMSPILENNIDGKGLNRHEMLSNAWHFINAGSGTTAGILSATVYFLARDPKILSIITAELPYLLYCLSETNRIMPVVLMSQAVLVPPRGATICGYWVPGNTGVTNNQYACYRSKTNFKNPDNDVPERWLDDPDYVSDQRQVLQPFSYGARNCIGKRQVTPPFLGTMELQLALARTIWNFDVGICEESAMDWDDQKVYMIWKKTPLIIRLAASTQAKSH